MRRYNITGSYSNDNINLSLTARGVSKHSYNASNIECASGCPASNLNFQTIDNNTLPSVWWFDTSLTYTFRFEGEESTRTIQTYLNVQNMLNKDPPLYSRGPTGIAHSQPNADPTLYDQLGRVFRAGVRFRM